MKSLKIKFLKNNMFYILTIFLMIAILIPFTQMSLKRMGIKRISKKANQVNKKLSNLLKNKSSFIDIELYSKWLEDNPEVLWTRILTHANNNKKILGDLGAKLWQACEAIDRMIKLDYQVRTLIGAGGVQVEELGNLGMGRKNLIAIIDQSLADIKVALKK